MGFRFVAGPGSNLYEDLSFDRIGFGAVGCVVSEGSGSVGAGKMAGMSQERNKYPDPENDCP